MAVVWYVKTVTLKLKTTAGSFVEYNGNLASAHIEVSPGDQTDYPTLDGGVSSEVGSSTYALVLRGSQDYSATGLARFLWDNEGAVLDFDYNMHGLAAVKSATTPAVTGQVRAVAGAYGGEVNTFAEIEITLPCIAKPVLDTTP
jgi:hypothetical protein